MNLIICGGLHTKLIFVFKAFSVFFVCVTATSDLVCYLFIPIQVLIFLATDRGICLPSIFLWALFIIFEYSVRYRFDNATWYLTRTSWVTAGLFPSTADSVSVGSPSSSASSTSPRLELYRPFAAHCIGFPVVTLGFRVKSFFRGIFDLFEKLHMRWESPLNLIESLRIFIFITYFGLFITYLGGIIIFIYNNIFKYWGNWRMRIRRDEVRRQNEFYERILADALPASFENRKHFISSRSHFSIEQQETFGNFYCYILNFDSNSGFSTTEFLNGLDGPQSTFPRLCSNSTSAPPLAAICASPLNSSCSGITSSFSSLAQSSSITNNNAIIDNLSKKQQRLSKQSKQQNEALKRNGIGNTALEKSWRGTAKTMIVNNGSSSYGLGNKVRNLLLNAFRLCCLFVLSTLGHLFSSLTPSMQQTIERLLSKLRGVNNSISGGQDDLISSSGDGSHVAEEEDDWERDSYQTIHLDSSTVQSGKRRTRRPRGLSTLSSNSTTTTIEHLQQQSSSTAKTPTTPSSCSISCVNGDLSLAQNAGGNNGNSFDLALTDSGEQIRDNTIKINEIKQLLKQKQILEQSVEKLKNELKTSRNGENDLRSQLASAQQQEQSTRCEWRQYEREQKQKLEQIEQKNRQLGKQNEHFKTNIQALEKRLGELQLKKLEIERELANERLTKQQQLNAVADHSNRNMLIDYVVKWFQENGELQKQKLINMDKELKQLKREMKNKDEFCSKLDEEIRRLTASRNDESKQKETLRQKNFLLEQTLSAENRLKQDLFRALNDSKAEIASMKAQLRAKHTKDQADMMNAFSSISSENNLFQNGGTFTKNGEKEGGGSLSTGSSPTQQQFPSLNTQKSLTPPPLSVASSTLNLEQLLQATQNMSYSLSPIVNSNGITGSSSGIQQNGQNCTTSSPYINSEASEMLAVGGHRVGANINFNSSNPANTNNKNCGGGQ
ncbi:hypothetical protein Mgra_00010134 [Meloidogyne graminicola]|uniref:Uncharacterized protein n=1 Tax=Meloidogyne graminicola TaxID=189291 RepID=A0A8S9ZD24_9BILA|nr:hypothetical protein Mgra_00010134 [Meloidogyne graminicola]